MAYTFFWNDLYQLRFQVNYLELLLSRTELIDRAVKMFLGVVSCSSIGGWAIWKEYAFFWGAVIAITQVINAVNSYLPYKERLKALSGLLGELEELALFSEMKWLDIETQKITDAEIKKYISDIRTRKMKALKKYFPSNVIPSNKKFCIQAEAKTEEYFSHFYQLDNEE